MPGQPVRVPVAFGLFAGPVDHVMQDTISGGPLNAGRPARETRTGAIWLRAN